MSVMQGLWGSLFGCLPGRFYETDHREGVAGAPWDEQELAEYKAVLADLFRPAYTKKKRQGRLQTQPRTASMHWLRALENALLQGLDITLSQFLVDERQLQQLADPNDTSVPPPLLVLITDQQSTQIAALTETLWRSQVPFVVELSNRGAVLCSHVCQRKATGDLAGKTSCKGENVGKDIGCQVWDLQDFSLVGPDVSQLTFLYFGVVGGLAPL